MAIPIFKTDNTGAFGNNFITININNPLEYVISKAEFVVNGGMPKIKPFLNPVFPLVVNFTSEQTAQLKSGPNTGKLIVWDAQGRQLTCRGTLTFGVENGAICNGCQCK